MKIIALGGAGDMGSEAVLDLARREEVETLVIGDYDEKAAQSLAAQIGSERVSALRVDAGDREGLIEALEPFDVVASSVGPFYRFEHCCADAAIEAGCHYVSLCDDYDAAQAVLDLDDAAKQRDVTVLTGLGWTPGISNVLARKAAEQLASLNAIEVAWGSSASDSEGFAVILHTLHIFCGMVPSWQQGRLMDVPAGSGKQRVRFPEPLGDCNVFHVGHPEPVTLPLTYRDVQTVTLKGGLSEEMLNSLTRLVAKLRLSNTHGKRVTLAKILKALLPIIGRIGRPEEPCSGIRVDVTGTRNGETHTITYGATDNMNRLTGLPLAIGALMLGRGEITQRGVVAPEACISPDAFISELGEREITVYQGDELTTPLAQ